MNNRKKKWKIEKLKIYGTDKRKLKLSLDVIQYVLLNLGDRFNWLEREKNPSIFCLKIIQIIEYIYSFSKNIMFHDSFNWR